MQSQGGIRPESSSPAAGCSRRTRFPQARTPTRKPGRMRLFACRRQLARNQFQQVVFGKNRDAQGNRLVVFASRRLTCNQKARLLRDARRNLRAACFKLRASLITRHPALNQGAGKNEGQTLKRLRELLPLVGRRILHNDAAQCKTIDNCGVIGRA